MIDDITKLAALVSTSLNKVDRNMLSTGSAGPANKINIHNFVKPQPAPVSPTRELVAEPPTLQESPSLIPTPALTMPVQNSQISTIHHSGITSADLNKLTNNIEKIATELGKINKKMTSIQKYLNQKTNEQPESKPSRSLDCNEQA